MFIVSSVVLAGNVALGSLLGCGFVIGASSLNFYGVSRGPRSSSRDLRTTQTCSSELQGPQLPSVERPCDPTVHSAAKESFCCTREHA